MKAISGSANPCFSEEKTNKYRIRTGMRLLPFFCLFPLLLRAQSDLLKDPDIVWAAGIEQDWVIDVPSLEKEQDEGLLTLKLMRTERSSYYTSSVFLSELVFQAMVNEKLPIFKDPRCTRPTDIYTVYPSTDTIVTFNPETYEETVSIVRSQPYPYGDFVAWRLRQILAYHRQSATWSTTVEAIAPLVRVIDRTGDSIGVRPLCWFRPDNQRREITDNNIVWAKMTENRQPATLVPVTIPNPLKASDGFRNPVFHLLQVLEKDMEIPFYNATNDKLLSPGERHDILARVDTVQTYDHETMEEIRYNLRHEISPDNIRMLRLVQTWYWDRQRQRLSISLDAVGPLKDVTDMEGNLLFRQPLFFRRTSP